ERTLLTAVAEVLPGRSPRPGDDFFADLGGHSLAAARLVSLLRTRGHARAAVRLVYAHRRLGAIAAALAADAAPAPAPAEAVRRPSRVRRGWCGLAMLLLLPVPVCLHLAGWLAPFFTYHILTGDEGDSVWRAAAAATAVFALAQILPFAAALAAKWLVLGRMPAGRHPLWGQVHLRWWFADVMQRAAPVHLLHGTPLLPAWLRALGARVGRDVHLAGLEVRAPDLLTLGDHATVGAGVLVANVRFAGGWLVAGSVRLGAQAVVGSGAVLEGPATIGAGAELGDLASLPGGRAVPDGECWQGVPARPAGRAPAPDPAPAPGPWRRLGEAALYPLAALALAALFFLPVFPAFVLIDWLDGAWLDSYGGAVHTTVATGVYLLLGVPAAAVLLAATLAVAALLRRLLCGGLRPGRWPVHGAMYYRKWVSDQVQENSLQLLHGLFATVYAPHWFRLIGVRVGRGAEISTATGITPELLELGDDSFIADGALLGDEQVRDRRMVLMGTRVGARAFVGNGACVPDGSVLPDGVLIGVQTLAPPAAALAPGQTWMGSPALLLPARELHGGHPEALTFRPGRARWCARAAIELARIVLPLAFIMAYGYLAVHLVMPLLEADAWLPALVAMAGLGFLYGLASVAAVLAAKWLLIGRYRPRAAPMWTPFVWLSEAVTSMHESLAVPNLLDFLRGTPLLPVFLRLYGARIGRDTVLDSTDLTEFDCVEIGDGAVLNADCGPQTHLFEDRVMTVGLVRIGADAVLGARTIVLYDAEVGARTCLGPLTLVAKGERLPADGAWCGAPAAPA
ncbi:MAG: phosphopantetheine-binding protein, partial [Planctomycetes bacterium]|nr:phosphopantetheine-binding protein [Planctomycetota bacterium]